jgi:hypothetical protein
VHQVFGWILTGATEHEIREAIAKAWPDADAKPLIIRAMKQIVESGEADAALIKGFCIEASRSLFQKALEAADYPTALRAIAQLHRIAGK